jgi:hypothetical protein
MRLLDAGESFRQAWNLPRLPEETRVSQASRQGSTTRVVGDVLIVAAILIALINNHTIQWAIGVPIVLAVVGIGLRVEAAISRPG